LQGFKPWFRYVPRIPKTPKNVPNNQPNMQFKNLPKMTTKITKKGKFIFGRGEVKNKFDL
jgi:hypothetical protein